MENRAENSEGSITREEVAPGLVMEKRQTAEPDGRYLLYYRFRRQNGGETEDGDGEPEGP